MAHTCPVCGFAELSESPHDIVATELCAAARGQISKEAHPRLSTTSHAELRKRWLAAGAPWFNQVKAPPNWNAVEQLKTAGLGE
jgi:hypothetical protein